MLGERRTSGAVPRQCRVVTVRFLLPMLKGPLRCFALGSTSPWSHSTTTTTTTTTYWPSSIAGICSFCHHTLPEPPLELLRPRPSIACPICLPKPLTRLPNVSPSAPLPSLLVLGIDHQVHGPELLACHKRRPSHRLYIRNIRLLRRIGIPLQQYRLSRQRSK